MLPTWYTNYKKFIDNSIKLFLDEYLNPAIIPAKAGIYKKKDYDKLIDPQIKSEDDNIYSEWQIICFSKPLNDFKEIIYYATNSWKRVRAILALEVYLNLTNQKLEDIKQDNDIVKVCVALEFIHAYSLLHDDLPCMDNDEYRRGQLTVWKKYGETNAVLCGDLLNTLSFEILSTIKDNEKSKKIINLISRATSIYGMIWWQIEDIYFEHNINELDLSLIESLHNKKTWKLIEASVLAWMILAKDYGIPASVWIYKKDYDNLIDPRIKYEDDKIGISQEWQMYLNLSSFWQNIWLAFQVKDDILDVEWTFEETGKSVWWEKKWFVHFIWLEKSKDYLEKLSIEALKNISDLKSEKLDFLVEYIKNRNS